MTASWRVLSRRIAARLPPGFVRFQAGPIKRGKLAVQAFYRASAPKVAPFTLRLGASRIRVEIQTHALRPPSPSRSAPRDKGFAITAGAAFTGVHPGAAIAIDLGQGARELGAICALLSRNPTDPRPTHLVTCGHVFPPKSKATEVIGGLMGEEAVIGRLTVNLLDRARQCRDVALVELTPIGAAWATAKSPGPKLEDYFPANRIFSRSSRTFRPTTGGYSPATQTADDTISVLIDSKLWHGGFAVEDLIPTTSAVSQPGDSGTILATSSPPIAIGSCSASEGGQSLFEPIGRVIDDEFAPQYQLTLWKNP